MLSSNAMSESLYEQDILAWSEQQAAALRRRESGHNALDYENLAEEIGDVGLSILHGCESQLENILEHMLKIEYVRSPQDIAHWRGEIYAFRRPLRKRLSPSMRRRIETELDETIEAVVKGLTVRGLLTAEEADEALERGRTLDEILAPDWYPSPRYE